MDRDVIIDALGVRVRLDVALLDDAEIDAVAAAWDGARALDAGPIERHVRLSVRSDGADGQWLSELSRRVTRTAIEVRKGEGWMLHAAGLADVHGRVAALVGPSGAGKTTAARALTGAGGLSYVSDETVFVDASARVAAYRKPLSVIEPGHRLKRELAVGAGGPRGVPGLRLGAIVLLDRRPDADPVVVERMGLAEALPALVAQSSYLPLLSDPLQTLASLVAAGGGVHRVSYADADALAPVVTDLLRLGPAEPEATAVAMSDPSPDADDAGFRRATVTDAVRIAGALAVMHDDVVHVLDGVGPAAWESADGRDRDAIASSLIDRHGAPPDATSARDAVDALIDARLLVPNRSGVRVRSDVAWIESATGEVVVLPLGAAPEPLALGETGSVIWRVLVARPGASLVQVRRRVAAEYLELPDDFAAQVSRFVDSLTRRRLVERV